MEAFSRIRFRGMLRTYLIILPFPISLFHESMLQMLTLGDYPTHEAQFVLSQFVHIDHWLPLCAMVHSSYNFASSLYDIIFPLNIVVSYNWCFLQVIPVLVNKCWSAYMLDMQQSKVHIIDLLHCKQLLPIHKFILNRIYPALATCLQRFFDCWPLSPAQNWHVHYPKLCNEAFPRQLHQFVIWLEQLLF
jgi:hypothetical protein